MSADRSNESPSAWGAHVHDVGCFTPPSSCPGPSARSTMSASESLEESVRAVLAGNGGTMGAVADGLAKMRESDR